MPSITLNKIQAAWSSNSVFPNILSFYEQEHIFFIAIAYSPDSGESQTFPSEKQYVKSIPNQHHLLSLLRKALIDVSVLSICLLRENSFIKPS